MFKVKSNIGWDNPNHPLAKKVNISTFEKYLIIFTAFCLVMLVLL